jgi:hypothetical protein
VKKFLLIFSIILVSTGLYLYFSAPGQDLELEKKLTESVSLVASIEKEIFDSVDENLKRKLDQTKNNQKDIEKMIQKINEEMFVKVVLGALVSTLGFCLLLFCCFAFLAQNKNQARWSCKLYSYFI